MDYQTAYTIRTAAMVLAFAGIFVAYLLRQQPPADPVAAALEICGDMPKPVEYTGSPRAPTLVEPDQRPYALAVKSVDECRAKVLDHFRANQP